jgi:PAS domain S-box-containing protein
LNENDRNNFIKKQRITGKIVREEIELKRKDGKSIWVRDTGRTILDENKNPIFTDGIIEDITDRKIARRELEFQYNFLQILIDTIPNPIYYKDAVEKRYIGCNLAFTNFFDKTKEEIIGKSVFDLYPLDAAIIYDEKDCELIKKGGIQRYDDSMKDAKGKLHYNIIYRSRYNDSNGNTAGIVGIVLDITEMTIAQEQLFWESSMNSAMAALSQAILSEMSIQKISEWFLVMGKN